METAPVLSINIDKVTQPEFQTYSEGIDNAIKEYDIDDSAFSQPKEQVINTAIRILSSYEIKPEFLTDPEKVLFTLAIADSWTKETTLEEKKALLTCFKLLTVVTQDSGDQQSASDKIIRMSAHNIKSALQYDPKAPSPQKTFVNDVLDFTRTQIDNYLTRSVQEELADRSEGSTFYDIRKKLGVVEEKPFDIYILKIPSKDIALKYGFPAMNIIINNKNILILGNDYEKDYGQLYHEYAHSQSGWGLRRGYGGLLGRGLDEAFTESLSLDASSYKRQCDVLYRLYAENPNYQELIKECYMQRDKNSKDLYNQLIKDYKLSGFLRIQRMSAESDDFDGKGKSKIFIKPEDILPKKKQWEASYDEFGNEIF